MASLLSWLAGFFLGNHDTVAGTPGTPAITPGADARRTAYLPVTNHKDGEVTASKFSGTPWLSEKEEWPVCGHCGKPLTFFLQLSGRDTPAEAGLAGDDLIQLFYCIADDGCEYECDGWDAVSAAYRQADPKRKGKASSVVIRLVKTDNTPSAGTPAEKSFPAKTITGWTPQEDYPSWEDYAEHASDDTEEEEHIQPLEGEKLLGWPFWVQGAEWRSCPVCGTPMRFLFQLDSDKHIPYMFGDCGIGHICQCPRHPEVLSFGWACY